MQQIEYSLNLVGKLTNNMKTYNSRLPGIKRDLRLEEILRSVAAPFFGDVVKILFWRVRKFFLHLKTNLRLAARWQYTQKIPDICAKERNE